MGSLSRHTQVIGFVAAVAAIALVIRYIVTYEPAPYATAAVVGNTIHQEPAGVHEPAGPEAGIQAIVIPDKPRAPDWLAHLSSPSPLNGAGPPATPAAGLPPPITPPTSPYSHVGLLEQDGVRMAVLARGDRILLKKQGEDVDSEFRLAAVEPPALLHLPTGSLLPIRRSTGVPQSSSADAKGVSPLATQPTSPGTSREESADSVPSAAEIAADIAAALAAPVPEPIVQSSFPLAR